jgi:hypothetical protein
MTNDKLSYKEACEFIFNVNFKAGKLALENKCFIKEFTSLATQYFINIGLPNIKQTDPRPRSSLYVQ